MASESVTHRPAETSPLDLLIHEQTRGIRMQTSKERLHQKPKDLSRAFGKQDQRTTVLANNLGLF